MADFCIFGSQNVFWIVTSIANQSAAYLKPVAIGTSIANCGWG